MSIDKKRIFCQNVIMTEDMTAEDQKKAAIMDSAFEVFARYGFKRTSMEDIAKSAGMSRPALYQHFRNKEAIARLMVQSYFTNASAAIRQALAQPGPLEDMLDRAFIAKVGPLVEKMLISAHGAELLESSASIAQEELAQGMAEMREIFADWLRHEAQSGRVTLQDTPEDMAALILTLLEAIKQPPVENYEANRKRLARMVALSLAS
jgi:AcrR family transcriptional regulator